MHLKSENNLGHTGDSGGVLSEHPARLKALANAVQRSAFTLERRYLGALRYVMLALATIALLGSISMFTWGAIQQVGRSEVDPEPISLRSADLAPDTPEEARKSGNTVVDKNGYKVDGKLRSMTLAVYRDRFATYERDGENPTENEIVESVWPEHRWKRFEDAPVIKIAEPDNTELLSSLDKARHAVKLAATATKEPGFISALGAYKTASKVKVCRDVTRTRVETVESWDDYATFCDGWYYRPYGCATTRTIREPYTEKVCEMQYPEDLENPRQAFAHTLDRFLAVASVRSESADFAADKATTENQLRKADGRTNMMNAGKWFLGFIAVMLIYLMVAMERHHRLLRGLINNNERNVPQVDG